MNCTICKFDTDKGCSKGLPFTLKHCKEGEHSQEFLDMLKWLAESCTGNCETCNIACTGKFHKATKREKHDYDFGRED